mmetsp:Transcript_7803/g.13088  ORF Transcript_7803/g.13088 Transcript_7803/m.13088 type:complete len:197 (+) Transcript_7803:121-711(+)|eukprot:CAMPEP_0168608192 /NCGR_PEP_ID=MMETSP0449_2-20121227/490_1 /TAXON_ID=1082188 /ORGANISM="Strombidium rassoulzadegani, Strain ras09" /LENGTH=196 /DNA_ID=CAMNT_0008648149 /DNA_START=63 /DNA_END=653 /DNA_ORIENTATION=+
MNKDTQVQLYTLINEAQDNEDVKVIMLHGGRFYGSGNDLSVFVPKKGQDLGKLMEDAKEGACVVMPKMLMSLAKSVKPIITVVRGGCLGISFTKLVHSTFIYCSPDAYFETPFIKSAQSPEGGSTLLFPQIMGTRVANEILLTDKRMTADMAVKHGFANGVVHGFDPKSDWFNPNLIPIMEKLLSSDYRTIVNSME